MFSTGSSKSENRFGFVIKRNTALPVPRADRSCIYIANQTVPYANTSMDIKLRWKPHGKKKR